MKVVLTQHIKGVGQKGEVKEVSEGYFRNMLAPRRLAVVAEKGAIAHIQNQKIKETEKLTNLKESAESIKSKIQNQTITLNEKASPTGKLYASVSLKEIVQAIKDQLKVSITENAIQNPPHIKEAGDFILQIKLHPEVFTELKIHVLAN